jgi:hypothetical protein
MEASGEHTRASYLAVCAMYRDDASYLREWIELHRLVGAERFYLYNNLSTDAHADVLAPYVAAGRVVLHDLLEPFSLETLMKAARHCITEHRGEARWVAFLDIDEFLFSPTGRPVAELLREYEQWPGVFVQRLQFGTSGHVRRPPGLVIESYLRRMDRPWLRWTPGQVKVIVDPARVASCDSPHQFTFTDGHAVDEAMRPVDGSETERQVSFSRLRVNHYVTKSEEEYREKIALWEKSDTRRKWAAAEDERMERYNEVEDTEITSYLPELRAALELDPATR